MQIKTNIQQKIESHKWGVFRLKKPSVHALPGLCTLNIFEYEISLSCGKFRNHHQEPLFGHGNTIDRGWPVTCTLRTPTWRMMPTVPTRTHVLYEPLPEEWCQLFPPGHMYSVNPYMKNDANSSHQDTCTVLCEPLHGEWCQQSTLGHMYSMNPYMKSDANSPHQDTWPLWALTWIMIPTVPTRTHVLCEPLPEEWCQQFPQGHMYQGGGIHGGALRAEHGTISGWCYVVNIWKY